MQCPSFSHPTPVWRAWVVPTGLDDLSQACPLWFQFAHPDSSCAPAGEYLHRALWHLLQPCQGRQHVDPPPRFIDWETEVPPESQSHRESPQTPAGVRRRGAAATTPGSGVFWEVGGSRAGDGAQPGAEAVLSPLCPRDPEPYAPQNFLGPWARERTRWEGASGQRRPPASRPGGFPASVPILCPGLRVSGSLCLFLLLPPSPCAGPCSL